jgi:hypothetical protein
VDLARHVTPVGGERDEPSQEYHKLAGRPQKIANSNDIRGGGMK